MQHAHEGPNACRLRVHCRPARVCSQSCEPETGAQEDESLASLARTVDCPVYDRARFAPGHAIAGPAIVEQLDATTVLRPQQRLLVDRFGNFVITLEAQTNDG